MDNTKLSRIELAEPLRSVGCACTARNRARGFRQLADAGGYAAREVEDLETGLVGLAREHDQPGNDVVPVDEVADRGEGIHDDGTTGQGLPYHDGRDRIGRRPATVHIPQPSHRA